MVFNNGATGTVTAASATQLTVTFGAQPAATGSLTAVVTSFGGSSGAAVQVATIVAAPTVTLNTANRAISAPTIDIAGTGFDAGTPANNTVVFNNGATGTVTVATATQLTVTFGAQPAATGSLTAVVTSFGGSSGAAVQVATIVGAPTVTLNTANLPQNATQLIIAGTNFSTTAANNAVVLNSGTGTVTSATATQLTCSLVGPLSLGSLTAVVNVNGGSSGAPVQVATVVTPLALPVINVGAGGDYPSLTNAGGLFEALNGFGTSVNITVNITSDLAGELGTHALNELAGGFTVLIRPSGGPRSIVGTNASALIRLNGADRVTIDGSTSGATATGVGGNAALRELTIQNTNAGTAAVVISVGSGTNGAQNNIIRNVNVIGQDPLTTLIGISLGGTTPGTVGTDNDNNRVENCSVKRVIFGVYSAGVSLANQNTGTVITRNDISSTAADRVSRVGILVFNDNGVQITENSVGGLSITTSNDALGIGVGTQSIDTSNTTALGVTNALVARNKINGVASLSTVGFSAAGIAVAGATGGANTVVNNMITGVTAPATSPDIVAGIYVVGAAGSVTRLYHNSIAMTGDRGTVATQTPSYGVAITGVDPTVELKNNIFYTTQTASGGGANAKSYAIGMVTTTFVNLDSNYNDFFASGVNAGFFRSGSLGAGTGTDYATLAAWQAAVSDDANSRSDDPSFVSPASDLHITLASTSRDAGTVVAVATDFDGDLRPQGIAPDIGADENGGTPPLVTTNPVSQLVTVGGTASFTAAASGVPAPGIQWEESTDGGFTFNPIGGATTSPLSFTVSFAQNGNRYRAVFSNGVGSPATTTAATLAVNRPPVASTFTIMRYPTQPVKLTFAEAITAGNVSDPDAGDTVTVSAVSGGTHGTPSIVNGRIFYTPNVGDTSGDTFTYTVQDNHGATASSTITVGIVTDNATAQNITKLVRQPDGTAVVDFAGIPGFIYGVQYTDNLANPWQNLGPVTVNSFGAARYTDNDPVHKAAPMGFYRFIYPAPPAGP